MWLLDLFKSSPKIISTVTDLAEDAAKGIDKMFYTAEEKAEASQKYFDTWLDFQKTIANESSATAVSRRVLAFMIMGVFLFLILGGVALFPLDKEWSGQAFHAASQLSTLAAAVGTTYFIKDAIVKSIQASKEGDSK